MFEDIRNGISLIHSYLQLFSVSLIQNLSLSFKLSTPIFQVSLVSLETFSPTSHLLA